MTIRGLVCASLLTLAACTREPAVSAPAAIDFLGERLEQATIWERDGLSGVVYVRPGDSLPTAVLQVGVLGSRRHASAEELHRWIREQFDRAPQMQLHDSGGIGEACRVAVASVAPGERRAFMALQLCRTRVGGAVCVEADESLDEGTWASCLNNVGCFEDVCDVKWLQRREVLERLATSSGTW